jgi:hypothetical protein
MEAPISIEELEEMGYLRGEAEDGPGPCTKACKRADIAGDRLLWWQGTYGYDEWESACVPCLQAEIADNKRAIAEAFAGDRDPVNNLLGGMKL